MIELHNEDCRSVLDSMIAQNKKVDLIITSPPYNMNLRVNNGKYVSRLRNKNHFKEFSTKYANYTDDLSMDDYFSFQDEFIDKALKISNIVFYNIQFLTGNKIALLQLMGKYADKVKEIIVWNKVNAQPAMQSGVLNSQYEFVIVFDNDKAYNRMFDKYNFSRGGETNVWDIKRERNEYIKAGFPKTLIKRILEDFTNEGDLIMDAFMGSGTTGIVCKELKRNFIGCELDTHYYEIAKERIFN